MRSVSTRVVTRSSRTLSGMRIHYPDPRLAPFGLRAIAMVARAAEGGIDQPHLAIMAAVQRLVLQTDLDVDQLEEIDAEQLAENYDGDALAARQLVRGMVVLSLAVGPPTPRQTELITVFAAALGVDEPAVHVMDHLANEEMLRFRLDFYRRSHLRDYIGTQYRTQGGILGVAKAVLGLRGLVEDAALAARFRAFGELPEDTLGHGLFRYYEDNGFSFPGEPAGFPVGALFHDFGHVLGGYDSSPEGELKVAAFQAGYRDDDNAFFTVLFAVLIHTAGVNMAPIPMPVLLGRIGQGDLAEQMVHALARGSAMTTDLGDDWDFWAYVDLPLEEARARLGVPAAGASTTAVV